MGRYCACGVKYKGLEVDCECDWLGWHDLRKDKGDLPKEAGVYTVRVSEDDSQWETESEFSVDAKNWKNGSLDLHYWSQSYYDGWTGYRLVYAWKEKVINK